MRINKFVAEATGMSRRQADEAIESGRVKVAGKVAKLGEQVSSSEKITLDGETLSKMEYQYLLLNKPVGYVCSRKQQDEKPTIYSLLPEELHHLKVAGRLDADSCGLLILTNDGQFAHELMHPSHSQEKVYLVVLDRDLSDEDLNRINDGVELEDGISHMKTKLMGDSYEVRMVQGKNRQIRRSFSELGYAVKHLQRVQHGKYELGTIEEGTYERVSMPSTKKAS